MALGLGQSLCLHFGGTTGGNYLYEFPLGMAKYGRKPTSDLYLFCNTHCGFSFTPESNPRFQQHFVTCFS